MSLSGVKQTWVGALQMSAFDPKRTSAIPKRPCDVTPHLFLSAAASISNDAGKYLTLCHGLPASDEGNAPFHLIIDAFVDDLRALIEIISAWLFSIDIQHSAEARVCGDW